MRRRRRRPEAPQTIDQFNWAGRQRRTYRETVAAERHHAARGDRADEEAAEHGAHLRFRSSGQHDHDQSGAGKPVRCVSRGTRVEVARSRRLRRRARLPAFRLHRLSGSGTPAVRQHRPDAAVQASTAEVDRSLRSSTWSCGASLTQQCHRSQVFFRRVERLNKSSRFNQLDVKAKRRIDDGVSGARAHRVDRWLRLLRSACT